MTERHEILNLITDAKILSDEIQRESTSSLMNGDDDAADLLNKAATRIAGAMDLMGRAAEALRQYGEDIWPQMCDQGGDD